MQHINFTQTKNYLDLSEQSANIMFDCVKNNENAVLALAAGNTPFECYTLFVKKALEENLDCSKVKIVKLSEWVGLPQDSPASCEMYIKENILQPLNIKEENYISLNGETMNPKAECQRIKTLLDASGSIDLCVLGMGENGHIGLNEPSQVLSPFPHVVALDKKTKGHSMLKDAEISVSMGISLGMNNILTSKKILFLIVGANKNDAFNDFKSQQITTWLPASFLWLHSNIHCLY